MRRKEIPPRLKINVTNRRALELGALEYLRRPLDVLETLIRKNGSTQVSNNLSELEPPVSPTLFSIVAT
jgi:hypothetical protein